MLKFSKCIDLACLGNFSLLHRKYMSSRRPCRHWSTPCLPPPHTILKSGQPRHQPTVTSAKGSCGALPGKAWSAWSAEWSAMKSARTSWTPTVCRVSTWLGWRGGFVALSLSYIFQVSPLQLLLVFLPHMQRNTYCPFGHVVELGAIPAVLNSLGAIRFLRVST